MLRKYRLNGEFVKEYTSIADAVADDNKLQYAGIWACVNGRQRSYGGWLWRSDRGKGSGLLREEVSNG